MRLIPEGTPKDQAGPCPLSERVVEVARYTKDTDQSKRRYVHCYQCPECGVTELPCHHWWEPRGFGTPHKARIEPPERHRRKVKSHHNSRWYPL